MPPHTTGAALGTAPSEGDDGDGHHPNGGQLSNDQAQKAGGASAAVDPEGVLLASPSFGGMPHVAGDRAAAVDPAGVLLASASFCDDGREPRDRERDAPCDRRHAAGASCGSPAFGGDVPGNYSTRGNADGAGEESAGHGGRPRQREAAREAVDAPADEDGAGSRGEDAADGPWCLPEATLRALAAEALQAIAEGSDDDETGSDDGTGSAASARADHGPAAWRPGLGPVAESHSFSSASTEVVSNRSKPRQVPARRQRKEVMLVHGGGFDWSSDSS